MLVFDAAYGDRAKHDLGDAFWMIDSPANRRVAEQAWKTGSTDPNSALFTGRPSATAQDVVAKLQDIDLHHPDWTETVVVGVEPTAELASSLEAGGLSMTRAAPSFSIRRR